METGMGKSWDIATKSKSSADFSDAHPPVYDEALDLYYKAYWQEEELFIKEYRLSNGDTVHNRIEKVSYIVGSGQHTNSHIIEQNGYLYQAPITFYTQKGKWDLAPGFEDGQNTRFSRMIQMECISCHNGYPKHIEGSFNKYAEVPRGIDCERCHGPGEIHVKEKMAGIEADTSKGPDYSIVNPARLSTEAQNNLCQRCHLQGVAVLNDGKSFEDFFPSNKLKNTLNVFMPSFSGGEEHMIMASHVERMKMSDCYVNSGKMSCITCHNPHISVKATPKQQYNTACQSCHGGDEGCLEDQSKRDKIDDNCVACHMPKNSSIDIPHVAVTDHFIRRNKQIENKDEIVEFLGMTCYNNDAPQDRTIARGYMEFFERYQQNPRLLDSANSYLSNETKNIDEDKLRLYFLKKDYKAILNSISNTKPASIDNAWTAYRIAESYTKNDIFDKGVLWHERACELMPFALNFQGKRAESYLLANQNDLASETAKFIIKENPRIAKGHEVLAYTYLVSKDLTKAIFSAQKAIALDPNNSQSYINLASAYYQLNKKTEAKNVLLKANKLSDKNPQIEAMLQDLKK